MPICKYMYKYIYMYIYIYIYIHTRIRIRIHIHIHIHIHTSLRPGAEGTHVGQWMSARAQKKRPAHSVVTRTSTSTSTSTITIRPSAHPPQSGRVDPGLFVCLTAPGSVEVGTGLASGILATRFEPPSSAPARNRLDGASLPLDDNKREDISQVLPTRRKNDSA